MIKVPQSVDDYTALLEEGTPFTFSNIAGDGEFLTIIGWRGTNSDGKKSTPEKQKALAEVILEPRLTFHGYHPGHLGTSKLANAEKWLRAHGVNVPQIAIEGKKITFTDPDFGKTKINVRWVFKELISSANVRGQLGPFLSVLKRRPLLIVAPTWVKPFVKRMGAEGILIRPQKGWGSLDAIEKDVRAALARMPADTVVTWSLGYLSKVLQWRLAPDFP